MSSPDTADWANRRPTRRGSAEIYVERAEYFVQHADVFRPLGDSREWENDKLLYPAPADQQEGGILVRTGTFYGPVGVTVETELPQLHLDPGETAGIRIHARGKWHASDVQEIRLHEGAIEHHLIQLWRI